MKTYSLFIADKFKSDITATLSSDIDVADALEEAGYEFSGVYIQHWEDDGRWSIQRIDTGENVAHLIPHP